MMKLLLGALLCVAALPALAQTLVLKNLNLVNSQTLQVKPKHTLLIQNGKIKKVQKASDFNAPKQAVVINMAGKFATYGEVTIRFVSTKKVTFSQFNPAKNPQIRTELPANLVIADVKPTSSAALNKNLVHVLKNGEFSYLGDDKRLPFSSAQGTKQMLWLSGQLGNLPSTMTLAGQDIKTQMTQTMENIGHVLRAHQLTYDHIIKCTIMLADIKDWQGANQVYTQYFNHLPARSAFGAAGLALGAKVEVECIASNQKVQSYE